MLSKPQKTAEFGRLVAFAQTVKEAKSALNDMVARLCSIDADRPHIEFRFGHMFVVSTTADGFQSAVSTPEQIATNGHIVRFCCFSGPGRGLADEIDGARLHVAQNAWSADLDDETHIGAAGLSATRESEFRRWIRFQRAYLACKSEGMNDRDSWTRAHEIASQVP